MAFQRPTLIQLVDRIQTDFVSKLTLAGAILRRAIVYVMTRVYAGAVHMLHGHLQYLGFQIFPDTSDPEFLVRQASLFGLSQDPPDYAKATIQLTGTDASVAPGTTTILQSTSGLEYALDADATISGGVASANVTALEAGADSTLVDGAQLTFESPIAGIDSTATVTADLQDGSDQEDIEGLRTRLKARMAEPPAGGKLADYVEWAKEVTGVTRVWPNRLELGPGTVVVRFVRDGDVSPIPDGGEVAAVQAKLDAEAPATATVTAIAPIDAPLPLTLHISPDTSANRAAVEAAYADLLERTGSPGSTTLLSSIQTAIGSTPGIEDFAITSPSSDTTHSAGELVSPGTVTFT